MDNGWNEIKLFVDCANNNGPESLERIALRFLGRWEGLLGERKPIEDEIASLKKVHKRHIDRIIIRLKHDIQSLETMR